MSEIRIIGGEFKGKRISFPSKFSVRPTLNRIREMLFNWLMYDIKDSTCLDLFAGSGALGFEAYSRGAKNVVLIDKDNSTYKYLQKNCDYFLQNENFNEDKYLKPIHATYDYFLKHNKKKFDIIFLDPPYKSDYKKIINLIIKTDALSDNALLYVESNNEIELPEDHFELLKEKKSGDIYSYLLRKIENF